MDKKKLRKEFLTQYKKYTAAENKAEIERQKLNRIINQIYGKDMTVDMCSGEEIEFRESGDDFGCLIISDVLEKLDEDEIEG